MAFDGRQTIKALGFIKSEVKQGRDFPAPSAIARHMGWGSTSGVAETMARLARWGFVERISGSRPGHATKYRLTARAGLGDIDEEAYLAALSSRRTRLRGWTVPARASDAGISEDSASAAGSTLPVELAGD